MSLAAGACMLSLPATQHKLLPDCSAKLTAGSRQARNGEQLVGKATMLKAQSRAAPIHAPVPATTGSRLLPRAHLPHRPQ